MTNPESARATSVSIRQLIATVARHHPNAGSEGLLLIRRAHEYALGLPGLVPSALRDGVKAARTLAAMRVTSPALAATIVAAAAAPTALPSAAVAAALGEDVASLVEGVGRLASVRWDRLENEAAESLRKMFLAMAKDVRVVLIALALRVQRMRSLRAVDSSEGVRRTATETLSVFAPLANRLGIWQLKWELEDGALRVLEPETYGELRRLLADSRSRRQAFIDEVVALLKARLQQEGVSATVKGRPKHIYSIYKKMQRKQVSFGQIYDVSALRVTTERLQDCYAVLGLVHSLWAPIPSEFDDYVAVPKANGYQSLHTAVIGPRGRPVEVQIRTHAMHRAAEFGVAAHWAYKEGRRAEERSPDRFQLLRQLLDWEREVVDSEQLVESLQTDLFEDQIFVFTPEGDIIDLVKGSTPVDFAYRIHTMVGHRCRGARVNDQIVTLNTQLHTGDRVEILTHKHPQPSRDWMNPALGYTRTSSARSKVRRWYREQGRESAIQAGRDLAQKELARLDLKSAALDRVAAELGYASTDDLHAAIGYGDRRAQAVASTALQLERQQPGLALLDSFVMAPQKKRSGASGVSVDGVNEILGTRARCCNAVPGDDVIGFVTRGRGIVIHRRDCGHIRDTQEPERLVDIDWGSLPDAMHSVNLELHASARPGVFGDLLKLISHLGAYISSAEAHSSRTGDASLRLTLDFRNASHVVRVLERLDHHPDVIQVRRVH